MAIRRNVSIKDIARAADVSYSTVSRALNDSPLISQEVRQRIRELAQSMGYTPNALAQSLQSRLTRSIGLVITTISDPFFIDVVKGVEEAAREAGYGVFLASSNNDPDEEIKIIETLNRRRVDGVIVGASRIGSAYAARLEEIRIPVVMVNNQAAGPYDNLFSVAVDDYRGACLAMRHLLDLGHRRIGYIGVKNRPRSNERRLQGYLDTLRTAGFEPLPKWICVDESEGSEDFTRDLRTGQALGAQLLETGISAVFCYCDTVAAGLLVACHEAGLDLPRQLSVVGFDNGDLCEVVCPPLTTISQPKYEMGRMAMQMLLTSIVGGMVSDSVIDPQLWVRRSTARCEEGEG